MNIVNIVNAVVFLYLICMLGFFIDSVVYYLCNRKIAKIAMDRIKILNLPLFFVLGGGVYSFYEMFFSIFDIKSNIVHFMLLFIGFLGVYCTLYVKNRINPTFFAKDRHRDKIGVAIIIILFISVPLFLNMIMAMAFPQFNIDMIGYILIKAKIFTIDTYKNSIFMHDNMFAGLHYRYPPFVGMFFNLLFLFGCKTIAFYQLVNYFIFLLLGIQVYSYLKDRIAVWQALAWFFIFISTRSYYRHGQHMIDSTGILLSLTFLLAVFFLIEFNKKQDLYSLVTCSVLTGIATLIKNEGVFFGIIMTFLCFRMTKKRFLLYLFIWVTIALPWILYSQLLPPSFPCPIDIPKIVNTLSNLRYIASSLGAASGILLRDWNAAFILWGFSIAILVKTKHIEECNIFSVIILASLLLSFLLVWVIFPAIGVTLGVYPSGFFRFICHVYPMSLICVALGIGKLTQKV